MLKETKMLAIFPFILVAYEMSNYLANDMYLPALPKIVGDLHTSINLAQLTLTAMFCGAVTMQLLLGPLSDRYGRRPIFLGGGLAFISSTLVCALSYNISLLVIARFFQGCATCSVMTAGYSCIHESYQQSKAIQLLAVMSSITVLAPAFGPLIGSIILYWLNWHWIFGILFIFASIALALLWLWMPETNPREQRHPLNWKQLGANYLAIICNLRFMLMMGCFCSSFLGMIAWIAAGPFLIIKEFHCPITTFGIYQMMIFGCLIIGSQIVKWSIPRVNVYLLMGAGITITVTSSTISLLLAFLYPHFLMGLIFALMVFTFGASLVFSPAQRLAIEACEEPMGARMAVFASIMSFTSALGSILASISYTGTLFSFSIILVIAGALSFIFYWASLHLEKKYFILSSNNAHTTTQTVY